MTQTLFITGATGFVGSHVVRQALAAGHRVLALRRPGSRSRIVLTREPEWIEGPLDGDYTDRLGGVDVLLHLAAHTPNPPYAPLHECLYWNVYAAQGLAEQARAAGVRQFLVAGSCFEYGRAAQRLDTLAVDAPLEPVWSYPTSKAAASIAFLAWAREQGLQLKLLRIFQVYGEGEQASRLWPALRQAALAGRDFPMSPGEQRRDFVNVEDVATQLLGHLDFADTPAGEPRQYHIASGKAQTLLQFARHWWTTWDARGQLQPGALPYREGELMRLIPDPAGIRR